MESIKFLINLSFKHDGGDDVGGSGNRVSSVRELAKHTRSIFICMNNTLVFEDDLIRKEP